MVFVSCAWHMLTSDTVATPTRVYTQLYHFLKLSRVLTCQFHCCVRFVIHRNKINKQSKVRIRYLQHQHMCLRQFCHLLKLLPMPMCQWFIETISILTEMIGADLKSLRLSHNKPNFSGNLMLQKLHSSCPSFLPLIPFLVKSVQFCFSTHKSHKHHTKITKTSQKNKQKSKKHQETTQNDK